MHDCQLPPGIFGTLFVFATVAIVGNVAHLLSMKPPRRAANASDVTQWAKTGVALTALLIVVPLQITAFSRREEGYHIVVATSLLNHLLVDFYPLGLFALAVTRLRICLCRGNADILITKMSALLTLGLCMVPLSISVVLKALITVSYSSPRRSSVVHYCLNSTRGPDHTLQSYYSLFTIFLFDILPVILTFILYGVIQKRYSDSEVNSQRRRTVVGWQRRVTIVQHTRRNGRSIGLSVRLLASTMLLAWMPYVILKLIFWFDLYFVDRTVHHMTTLFAVIGLYFLSPIAEGIFLRHKRENLSELFKQITVSVQSRIQVDIMTTRNMTSNDNGLVSNDQSTCMPTHVFFTNSSNGGTKFQDIHDRTPDTTGSAEYCQNDQTLCNFVPQPGEKKRKVCFSSDLEQDCELNERMRRMSRKSMSCRRRKRSSTIHPVHNRKSQSSRFSVCKSGRNSQLSDCSETKILDPHDYNQLLNNPGNCEIRKELDGSLIYKRRKLYPRHESQSWDTSNVPNSEGSVCNSQISWIPGNSNAHGQLLTRQQRVSNSHSRPIVYSDSQITTFSVPGALRPKDSFAFLTAGNSIPSEVLTTGHLLTNSRELLRKDNPPYKKNLISPTSVSVSSEVFTQGLLSPNSRWLLQKDSSSHVPSCFSPSSSSVSSDVFTPKSSPW